MWTRRAMLKTLCGAACCAVGPWGLSASLSEDELVDLNTASISRLMKLPGMTQVWAARIVRFRPYRRKDDLVERGVVTGEVYARIKDKVVAHRVKQ